MKSLRLIGMALITVLLSVSYSACSSSDDDEPGGGGSDNKSLIVGKWKVVGGSPLRATHIEFKKDGSFSYTSAEEPNYEEHGNYIIEGDILYEHFSNEPKDDWGMSKITLLNNISLNLQVLKDSGEPTSKQHSFQRVN